MSYMTYVSATYPKVEAIRVETKNKKFVRSCSSFFAAVDKLEKKCDEIGLVRTFDFKNILGGHTLHI